jgi:hypothetical protein
VLNASLLSSPGVVIGEPDFGALWLLATDAVSPPWAAGTGRPYAMQRASSAGIDLRRLSPGVSVRITFTIPPHR